MIFFVSAVIQFAESLSLIEGGLYHALTEFVFVAMVLIGLWLQYKLFADLSRRERIGSYGGRR